MAATAPSESNRRHAQEAAGAPNSSWQPPFVKRVYPSLSLCDVPEGPTSAPRAAAIMHSPLSSVAQLSKGFCPGSARVEERTESQGRRRAATEPSSQASSSSFAVAVPGRAVGSTTAVGRPLRPALKIRANSTLRNEATDNNRSASSRTLSASRSAGSLVVGGGSEGHDPQRRARRRSPPQHSLEGGTMRGNPPSSSLMQLSVGGALPQASKPVRLGIDSSCTVVTCLEPLRDQYVAVGTNQGHLVVCNLATRHDYRMALQRRRKVIPGSDVATNATASPLRSVLPTPTPADRSDAELRTNASVEALMFSNVNQRSLLFAVLACGRLVIVDHQRRSILGVYQALPPVAWVSTSTSSSGRSEPRDVELTCATLSRPTDDFLLVGDSLGHVTALDVLHAGRSDLHPAAASDVAQPSSSAIGLVALARLFESDVEGGVTSLQWLPYCGCFAASAAATGHLGLYRLQGRLIVSIGLFGSPTLWNVHRPATFTNVLIPSLYHVGGAHTKAPPASVDGDASHRKRSLRSSSRGSLTRRSASGVALGIPSLSAFLPPLPAWASTLEDHWLSDDCLLWGVEGGRPSGGGGVPHKNAVRRSVFAHSEDVAVAPWSQRPTFLTEAPTGVNVLGDHLPGVRPATLSPPLGHDADGPVTGPTMPSEGPQAVAPLTPKHDDTTVIQSAAPPSSRIAIGVQVPAEGFVAFSDHKIIDGTRRGSAVIAPPRQQPHDTLQQLHARVARIAPALAAKVAAPASPLQSPLHRAPGRDENSADDSDDEGAISEADRNRAHLAARIADFRQRVSTRRGVEVSLLQHYNASESVAKTGSISSTGMGARGPPLTARPPRQRSSLVPPTPTSRRFSAVPPPSHSTVAAEDEAALRQRQARQHSRRRQLVVDGRVASVMPTCPLAALVPDVALLTTEDDGETLANLGW